MTKQADNKKVKEFLENNVLSVLSTVDSKSKVFSSGVVHSIDNKFNFYFITRDETRKLDNIKKDSHVAIAVSNKDMLTTVQATGKASLVDQEDDMFFKSIKKFISVTSKLTGSNPDKIAQAPISKLKEGGYVVIKVKPDWLRYADYNKDNNFFIEII